VRCAARRASRVLSFAPIHEPPAGCERRNPPRTALRRGRSALVQVDRAGPFAISSRAVDGVGRSQPEEGAPWNPRGTATTPSTGCLVSPRPRIIQPLPASTTEGGSYLPSACPQLATPPGTPVIVRPGIDDRVLLALFPGQIARTTEAGLISRPACHACEWPIRSARPLSERV
jgi:hypothetical protein